MSMKCSLMALPQQATPATKSSIAVLSPRLTKNEKPFHQLVKGLFSLSPRASAILGPSPIRIALGKGIFVADAVTLYGD